jgi:hypothetical protein
MSGTVGAIACDLIKGQFEPKQEIVRTWRVFGEDGKSAQQLGQDSQPIKVQCFKFDSLANCETWRNSIYALVGTVVTIVNSDGSSSGNALIINAAGYTIRSGLPAVDVKASLTLTIEVV